MWFSRVFGYSRSVTRNLTRGYSVGQNIRTGYVVLSDLTPRLAWCVGRINKAERIVDLMILQVRIEAKNLLTDFFLE